MLFEIISSKKIEKQFSELDDKLKSKFFEFLVCLKTDPVPTNKYDIKKIFGSKSTFRARIQKHRIIYEINWNEKRIFLLKFDKRKDRTYKKIWS